MADVRMDLSEIERAIAAVSERKADSSVHAAMQAAVQSMMRDVILNRMTGQYLGIVTGTARKSITGRADQYTRKVIGQFGSPLEYVRAHELGYQGPVNVRAHQRTRGGKSHDVRAHTRAVNMRARHFMRDTLRKESQPKTGSKIARRIIKAMKIAARQGRIPRAGELGV